ncbi:MAG: hypothetical protein ACKOZU_08815 [Planctomycetaceae bacterium]
MAASRNKMLSLVIALIIFVMISFILSVTTYLGFQQKTEEQKKAEAARSEMEKANRDRDLAVEEARRVRTVIGTDKDTADAVEAERTELFDRKYSGFDKDPKSFLRLVEWLADAIRAKDDDIKRLEAEKVQIRKDADAKVKQAEDLKLFADENLEKTKKELDMAQKDFKDRVDEHQQALGKMKDEQARSLAESERMRSITEELAKLGPLLSPDLRRKFAAVPPQGQPEPWPERVRFVFNELRSREKAIRDLNATLSKLRVADATVQKLVRDSIPEEERIDGFDGRISSVNSFDRTVLVVCDSTAGMRPGLLLSVFDPRDPQPRMAARKGLIEVSEVEGPTLARARIRRDTATSPILAGDGVATSLWAPGGLPEVVIVGYVRFGSGRREDAGSLKTLVERNGGKVVDAVGPTTGLVVDAGAPSTEDLQVGIGKDWKPADEAVRKRATDRAKEYGVRVVSLDGLLDMLGLDRESLDGRRLPNDLGAAP